ncbi:MAG: GNAT family N-acetyltransferase [Dongiaceae bacterium]
MTSSLTADYACMPSQRLQDGALSIEAIQPRHIESVRQWRNAQMNVLRQAKPISPDEQEAYYRENIWPEKSASKPNNVLLAYLERGDLIGYGGIVHLAWRHHRGEVSFLLRTDLTHDRDRYASYFSSFLKLLKRLAFDGLGLERLFTETYATRAHHVATLESVGFRLEGILKHHVWIEGRPVDSLIHGCLKTYER